MKRSIYSTATWIRIVTDWRSWAAFNWNRTEHGFREAITTLSDDHACMLDEVMEAEQRYCDLYRY